MSNGEPGPGVDSSGRPVIDPTENVKALTEAAVQRLDDLREAAALRQEDESRHVRELVGLRAGYEDQLKRAESARIDAIRAVDVAAARATAEAVTATAEALRQQVATTAQAQEARLASSLEAIVKDIADLRRSQYQAVGGQEQRTEARLSVGMIVGIVAAVIGLCGFLFTVAATAVTIYLATR
jgi:hypothetical protein